MSKHGQKLSLVKSFFKIQSFTKEKIKLYLNSALLIAKLLLLFDEEAAIVMGCLEPHILVSS